MTFRKRGDIYDTQNIPWICSMYIQNVSKVIYKVRFWMILKGNNLPSHFIHSHTSWKISFNFSRVQSQFYKDKMHKNLHTLYILICPTSCATIRWQVEKKHCMRFFFVCFFSFCFFKVRLLPPSWVNSIFYYESPVAVFMGINLISVRLLLKMFI